MRDILQEYKFAMKKVEVRESFEQDTIDFLSNHQKRTGKNKRGYVQRFNKVAAGFAVVIIASIGGLAVADEWKLQDRIREWFHDSISADKVEQEQYQVLDGNVKDGNIELHLLGAVGDQVTCRLLLELEIPNTWIKEGEQIGVDLVTYGASENGKEYLGDDCPAFEVSKGEKSSCYMIQYEVPEYWAKNSWSEEEEIILELRGIILGEQEHEEYHVLQNIKLPVQLTEEYFAASKNIDWNQNVEIKGRKVTVTGIRSSEYKTEVDIRFEAEDFEDAVCFWKSITPDERYEGGTFLEDSPKYICLEHNGELVAYSEDCRSYLPGPVDRESDGWIKEEYTGTLSFNPIPYKEGDILEVSVQE